MPPNVLTANVVWRCEECVAEHGHTQPTRQQRETQDTAAGEETILTTQADAARGAQHNREDPQTCDETRNEEETTTTAAVPTLQTRTRQHRTTRRRDTMDNRLDQDDTVALSLQDSYV